MSRRELRELVRKYKKDIGKRKIPKLLEKRGLPYYYKVKQITEDENTLLYIDLGFRIYMNKLSKRMTYNENDIIQIKKKKNNFNIIKMNDISLHMLYTYKGLIKEVVDGDTLWVNLDLGFDTRTLQKVRLRGINAASPETKAGMRAVKFLRIFSSRGSFISSKCFIIDEFINSSQHVLRVFFHCLVKMSSTR